MAPAVVRRRAIRSDARVNPTIVVDVATALALEKGFDALSVRAVASRLGVAPMTVYGHVPSAEHLRDLVVARLFQAVESPPDWDAGWEGAVRGFAADLRQVLLRHPAVLNMMLRSRQLPSRAAEPVERLLTALLAGGMTLEESALFFTTLFHFVAGHAQAVFASAAVAQQHVRAPDHPRYPEYPVLSDALRHMDSFQDSFDASVTLLVAAAQSILTPDPPGGMERG